MKDLEYFKKELTKILAKQFNEEKTKEDEISKALEMDFSDSLLKSLYSSFGIEYVEKSRKYGIGTIREWKGHKIQNAKDFKELGNIVKTEINRFKENEIVNELLQIATKSEEDIKLDKEYMEAIQKGDTEKIQQMVMDRAEKMGFKDAIPEQMAGCKIRTGKPPKKTKTVYKCFYVDNQGKPSALFIGNSQNIPMNVWVDATEAFHFVDSVNGRKYVPSMGNPTNKDAGKTGDTHYFPEELRDELIKKGYITTRTKCKNTITTGKGENKKIITLDKNVGTITALAYRPGWHGGDLPFFPQGGKSGNQKLTAKGKNNKNFDPSKPETNYENIHRWNQVIFECEMSADEDFTEKAKAEGIEKRKTDNYAEDDLQYMPENGFYSFTTNPTVEQQTGGKGKWLIGHSIKIKRALTEDECNKMLADNGLKPQEWESMDGKGIGKMDLSKLGYTGESYDAARKTLAPITYDDNGKIIPLSERFDKSSDDIRKSFSEQIKENLSKAFGLNLFKDNL